MTQDEKIAQLEQEIADLKKTGENKEEPTDSNDGTLSDAFLERISVEKNAPVGTQAKGYTESRY